MFLLLNIKNNLSVLNLVTEMLTPENKSLPTELRIKCKLDLLPTLRVVSSDETTSACFRNREIRTVCRGRPRSNGRQEVSENAASNSKQM